MAFLGYFEARTGGREGKKHDRTWSYLFLAENCTFSQVSSKISPRGYAEISASPPQKLFFPKDFKAAKSLQNTRENSESLPASLVPGKAPGGTSRKFGGVRVEVSGRGPRLLRSCLGVGISIRNPSEANF